jgi:hypothetical protein
MIDRRGLLIGGAMVTVMPGSSRAALPVPASRRLGFDVMRKGTKLGTHVLNFFPSGDGLMVQVAVDLAYRIAGITLYHYTHAATERWSGRQVVSLVSETNDNGKRYRVSGHREAGGLAVEGTGRPRYVAPADALPATHWNRDELNGPWINTQDGRLMRPKVAVQGIEPIPTASGGIIRARRYTLTGDVQLDMFYDDQLGWAGLSFMKGGAPIRYERQG